MKYIIFEDGAAVLFADSNNHRDIAMTRRIPVRSAGFCRIETARNQFDDIVVRTVQCYGRSDTLQVNSDPVNDEPIVREIFRGM